ncbi:MAG: gliding motility protein GldM [Bacteroidaceae bacterium]|nr:gliding motility protein GldM [Candidatus Colenecus caballi]MCQ2073428.1 gliding motility protein GldM [Bacteroidaceae bacterium]
MRKKKNERPPSARQKMINLMYIVLLAMLAMNVSSDVLNGFSIVEDSLSKSTVNSTLQNQAVLREFAQQDSINHEKVGEWYAKAVEVQAMSDSLYDFAEQLKKLIAIEADGENAMVDDIRNRDDLEAATQVMLNPKRGKGQELFNAINSYRDHILAMVDDETQSEIIKANFSTQVPLKVGSLGKNWQEYNFENMPVAAAVTLLTKLQNDVRYAEGEVLHTLVKNIDVGDLRVNAINAYVIPTSQNVVQGSNFSARIIMAAVDSTARPAIYIDGKKIDSEDGWYQIACNKTGDYTLNGYMELQSGTGVIRRDFSQKYSVVSPLATVSATMMNVLYAGYDNPVSISVPGVPSNMISASIKGGNGTIRTSGNGFIVKPEKVGQDIVIAVTANQEGRRQSMGDYTFKVRQLPDPQPFIEYVDENGTTKRYRGGEPLPKKYLLSADGIVAAIDDGLLNIGFKVVSFECTFFDNRGDAVPELSDGVHFSARQKKNFNALGRGKRFYIQRVKAIGPDGIERVLTYPLEVIIN